jgi:hypothetical protein
MARCEDWPCCGHEAGCCPDFDESGKQLNMKCTCGATVPLGSRYSICEACMALGDDEDGPEFYDDGTDVDMDEDDCFDQDGVPAEDYDGDL